MTKELNEKTFFIIKKAKYIGFQIYDNKSYDLTSAVRKLLALDELNDDKETSYHLQEVNFSMVDKPLKLTDEVKPNGEDKEQMDMPF
jgi:hypothetical protein|tara:strand:+ start:165 stop:425 length:261 start_codon:yes stop_codon:yes gene_type:complete